jgi:hypothetical protein
MDGMDDFGPTRLIDDQSLRVLRAKSATLDGMVPVPAAPVQPRRPRRRGWTVAAAVVGIAVGFVAVTVGRPASTPVVAAETRVVMSEPAPLAIAPGALLQAAASREIAASAVELSQRTISSPRPRVPRRPSAPTRRLATRR